MFTIHTKANHLMPAMSFDVKPEEIICNDVMLPKEFDIDSGFNPHGIRLWLIGHRHGPVCAIWASEQDALDAACDANMLECFLVSAEDIAERGEGACEIYTCLGNAGELHNLEDCWVVEVDLQAARDIQLIVKLAKAARAWHYTLDF